MARPMGNGAQQLEEVTASRATRPLYIYTIPETLRTGAEPIESIGLVELTADEQLMAGKRSRGDQQRQAHSLVISAIRQVNERAVNIGDASADEAWARMAPKLRELVAQAYAEIHIPTEGEAELFHKSRKVTV